MISYETEEQPTFADHLKIHEHYKVREEGHDAQGVEILMNKINVLDGINWQQRFEEMEGSCDVRLPVGNIEDSRFVLMYMLRQVHMEHNE